MSTVSPAVLHSCLLADSADGVCLHLSTAKLLDQLRTDKQDINSLYAMTLMLRPAWIAILGTDSDTRHQLPHDAITFLDCSICWLF